MDNFPEVSTTLVGMIAASIVAGVFSLIKVKIEDSPEENWEEQAKWFREQIGLLQETIKDHAEKLGVCTKVRAQLEKKVHENAEDANSLALQLEKLREEFEKYRRDRGESNMRRRA